MSKRLHLSGYEMRKIKKQREENKKSLPRINNFLITEKTVIDVVSIHPLI